MNTFQEKYKREKTSLFTAKPFLKWAGGKTQLLEQFNKYFPEELKNGTIKNYYEPFLGSGAVFFYIAQNYQIEKAYLSDINEDLILAFTVVQRNVIELIDELYTLKNGYMVRNEIEREKYFYEIRDIFNSEKEKINYNTYSTDWIPRAAKLIFLNKTCFNGLFRLNRKGEFNVPYGGYENPRILEQSNLINASNLLQIAEIFPTDFENIKNKIISDFFIYFDPPYRPISNTSSFTSYSKYDFTEDDQKRLAKLFNEISKNGNKLMLSNSDPKNINEDDHFFEEMYSNFRIIRVQANRMINSKGDKRGKINELLILNY
ncbi:MAG TPA: DNA adenine methylase [Bacteroidota bacterium]|nr:DNA adenine methylase [Candidatus Kapabacteria bacterium]HRS01826.1 DNA adenine methylase [Bacteroidota bacterium]